jgi:tRNA U38,U39,U40 pseudouridine synthase TruA
MLLETGQILSTVLRSQKQVTLPEGLEEKLYKATHKNHPCVRWVQHCRANMAWTIRLFSALSREYEYRFGKTHATTRQLEDIFLSVFDYIQSVTKVWWTFELPPLAMPDEFRIVPCRTIEDVIESYRRYYRGTKKEMSKWTKRPIPEFMEKT